MAKDDTAVKFFNLVALFCLILGLSGCAEIGLVVPAAAVSGGAAGVDYSFTNNAYKTMSYSIGDVEAALHRALTKMDIKEKNVMRGAYQIDVSAVTATLDINVTLEQITRTVTKIEVGAKNGFFFKDKSTAAEIIVQTERDLEGKQ